MKMYEVVKRGDEHSYPVSARISKSELAFIKKKKISLSRLITTALKEVGYKGD